jgi:hypothetical protein
MEETGPTQAFHKHETFKAKIRSDGTPVYGRIAIWYSKYQGDDHPRIIDPIAHFSNSNGKYLLAYCHLREAERTFASSSALWDVRDILTGKRFNSLEQWIEQAPQSGPALSPLSNEVREAYTGQPTFEDPTQAAALVAQFCDSLSHEGEWETSIVHEDDARFILTVKRVRNGQPNKNIHFTVFYCGRNRTWSHAMLPNGGFGPSELSSDRHNPFPWEPYCRLNRRVPLEHFSDVEALFDQMRVRSRKTVSLPSDTKV